MFIWWRIFMSLCLVENAWGPCVTAKDEGDPGRDSRPGSPIWPAKHWTLRFQEIGLRWLGTPNIVISVFQAHLLHRDDKWPASDLLWQPFYTLAQFINVLKIPAFKQQHTSRGVRVGKQRSHVSITALLYNKHLKKRISGYISRPHAVSSWKAQPNRHPHRIFAV